MDCFAPGIALGHAIGRIGCFAAGCCWGKECHLPWAVTFHSQEAAQVPLNVPLHPTQLYETGANLILFGILYRLFNRTHRPGEVIGWYLVLYSIIRFIIEFFRNHEQSLVAGFRSPSGSPLGCSFWAPAFSFACARSLSYISTDTRRLSAAAARHTFTSHITYWNFTAFPVRTDSFARSMM